MFQPKSGLPEVRILANPVVVVDNYFNLTMAKADLLLAPKHYPAPIYRYALQDMTLIWHMFGGTDFCSKKVDKAVQFQASEKYDDKTIKIIFSLCDNLQNLFENKCMLYFCLIRCIIIVSIYIFSIFILYLSLDYL